MELVQQLLSGDPAAGPGEMAPEPEQWSAQGLSPAGAAMSSHRLTVRYASRDHSPTNELYFVGWPAHLGADELDKTFSSLGFTVMKSNLLPDKKGFGLCAGFVHLASAEEAEAAISALNGQEIQWESADVPQPRRQAPGRIAPPTGAMGAPPAATAPGPSLPNFQGKLTVKYAARDGTPSNELFVMGWPAHLDLAMFNQMFESLGFQVVKSNLLPDTKGFGLRGGFAHLASQEEAERAIAELHGQSIQVEPAMGEGGPPQPSPQQRPPGGLRAPVTSESIKELAMQALTAIASKSGPGSSSGAASGVRGSRGDISRSSGAGSGVRGSRGDVSRSTLTVKYAARDGTPSNELYVMGWPAHLDNATFCQMFTSFGYSVIKSNLLPDTKGFGICGGFVHLVSQDEAAAAMAQLHGQSIEVESGNGSTSNELLPPLRNPSSLTGTPRNHSTVVADSQPRSANNLTVRFASRDLSPTNELYLMGWPAHLDTGDLNNMFTSMGFSVIKSNLLPDKKGTGLCGGFVHLASVEEAEAAIASLHGQLIEWDPADEEQLPPPAKRLRPSRPPGYRQN